MPANRSASARATKQEAASKAAAKAERQSQFTLQMRESLHKELARRAFNSGMTMRGYIMEALRKSGLRVTDADLVDRRRRD